MIKNRSPLRAYIYKAQKGGISRAVAWEIWKVVLAPRATASVFNAEWEAFENGRSYDKEIDYSPPIKMAVGSAND